LVARCLNHTIELPSGTGPNWNLSTSDPKFSLTCSRVKDDGAGSEGWTVFDLRKLRGEAISDLSLQRLILGYDLLVLIPEATPATQIR